METIIMQIAIISLTHLIDSNVLFKNNIDDSVHT